MKFAFKTRKQIWFLTIIAYFTVGYLTINWFNSERTSFYDIGFLFEAGIPFVPIFIFGYLLVYLTIGGLYFLIDDEVMFKRAVWAFIMLITIHFIFFVLIPVRMDLRPVVVEDSVVNSFVKFYYWLDMPQNCFPSLHVAFPFLGALLLWKQKRMWSWIYIIATIIISISVILIKQHYILDVIGGYVTPLLVCMPVNPKPKAQSSKFKTSPKF